MKCAVQSRVATGFVLIAATVGLMSCGDTPKPKPPVPVTTKAPAPPAPPSSSGTTPTVSTAAPPISPTAATMPSAVSTAESDPSKIEVAGIIAPKPTTWTWQAPTMQFRTLQYSVPGDGDSTTAAELVVSVFDGSDGGPIDGNIDRWAGQFRMPDGTAATPIRSEQEIDGMKVILVELTGAYSGMGASGPKPGTKQLAAIVRAPGHSVFLRLIGPETTVEAERGAWETLVAGLKKSA